MENRSRRNCPRIDYSNLHFFGRNRSNELGEMETQALVHHVDTGAVSGPVGGPLPAESDTHDDGKDSSGEEEEEILQLEMELQIVEKQGELLRIAKERAGRKLELQQRLDKSKRELQNLHRLS